MSDIDPALAELLSVVPSLDLDDLEGMRARALAARDQIEQQAGPLSAQVDYRDEFVDRGADLPPVLLRVMSGKGFTGPMPAIVYLHGGAFVLGEIESNSRLSARYVDTVPAVVVHVDYRLAPESPFPAAVEDASAAWDWVWANAERLGIDRDRIALVGSSAGAGLAAAVALSRRDAGERAPVCLGLMYPVLDDRMTTDSARRCIDTPVWNSPNMARMWGLYLGQGKASTDGVPVLAAPARAATLDGLAPAFVLACEFDPLHDENVIFARRLRAAGVDVELSDFAGTYHAFDHLDTEISARARGLQVAFLRCHLWRGMPAVLAEPS